VSPRTIRTDVTEINRNIRPFHAEIHSVRSKGYNFTAEDMIWRTKSLSAIPP
jgi:transcriptional antiterminator